jgi:CRISPR/Cas system-associated exonuclease Cas4 (RecB family)
LILGPTTEAADDLARAACDSAMLGIYRMSLAQLAVSIAEPILAAENRTRLDYLGAEALAYSVAREVLARLDYFRSIADSPGFPRALSRTLSDLRMAGVRPERSVCVADISLLLSRWEAALEQRGLADLASVYEIAAQAIPGSPFNGHALVEIDLQPRTLCERELLTAVRTSARAVHRLDTAGRPVPPIAVCSASSEALEAAEVARRIHGVAADGTPFDHIAILLRSPERGQPVIEEALHRAGIPAWFARGARRPDPAGRAFLALLSCARDGLTEAGFGEYLSLGQAPATGIWRWERMIFRAGVVASRERWHTRLKTLPETDEREALIDYVLPLVDDLAALEGTATWGEWIDRLRRIAEYALRTPSPVHDLLDELQPMSEVGPVGLRDVLTVLEPRLRSLAPNESGDRYGRVFVGSIDDAQGMIFRLAFLPGMIEGQFPRTMIEDPLLPNSARRAISADLPIAGDEDERGLFRVALTRASDQVVLSWSHLDVLAGRERVPSFYLLEAQESAGANDDHAEARLGWPAPLDAGHSIDIPEYDLAVLRRAFTGEAERGEAAWLKDVHSPAVDALRGRGRRWLAKWRSADGLIADDDISALIALGNHRPSNRAWSPTALQRYCLCPYQFALYGILRLRPREARTRVARIDPRTRGELFHRVQFRFLTDPANQSIDSILDEEATSLAVQLAPAIPQLWEAAIETIRTDLHGWLAIRRNEPGWTPVALEKEVDNVAILGGWRVKGRVDLVERHPQLGFRVVDHKTGRPPDEEIPESIGKGEVLQPAIYALAAEQLLSETVSAGRLFYSTLRANYRTIDVPVQELTRDRVNTLLMTIDSAIEKGFLPSAPREGGCEHCDYVPICGPWEQQRITIKEQVRLRPLKEVRKTP